MRRRGGRPAPPPSRRFGTFIVCSERALLIPYDTHLIVTEFMYQHGLYHEHLASNLTSLRRARDTPTRSQTAQDELAIGTTARPAVQIGRTRAPLTRASWDARRTPAPSSPGSIHASDARRPRARAATTHAAAGASPRRRHRRWTAPSAAGCALDRRLWPICSFSEVHEAPAKGERVVMKGKVSDRSVQVGNLQWSTGRVE